jgi:beta-glucosidase
MVTSEFRWATGIEDTFIAQESPGRRRLDEYELQQHYESWREDLDLASEIGFDSIRWGIPWYKVEPAPGEFDFSFPDQVFAHLQRLGIEPIVDLVHYGCPLWLEGEFANPAYPERVATYAAAVARRYEHLRCYTPLNEPSVNAELCGQQGRWPPRRTGDDGFVLLISAMCRGIVETVRALRRVRPDVEIVDVEVPVVRLTDEEALAPRLDIETSRGLIAPDLVQGRVGSDHALYDYLTVHGMSDSELAWFGDDPIAIDVLGVNYYPDACVRRWFTDEDGVVRQDPLWGGAEHLVALVRELAPLYGLPVFITETCVNERSGGRFWHEAKRDEPPTERDGWRTGWLEDSVAAIRALRAEGQPVIGYTWWPFLDAVSWEYRERPGPVEEFLEPAGLVRLQPDRDGSLVRRRLSVAGRMHEIIAEPI